MKFINLERPMTHTDLPLSLDAARAHVLQGQNPSVAKLQAAFRLGYGPHLR